MRVPEKYLKARKKLQRLSYVIEEIDYQQTLIAASEKELNHYKLPDGSWSAAYNLSVCSMESRIKALINDLETMIQERDSIIAEVKLLSKPIYTTILIKHYVNGKMLKEIAIEAHFSEKYIQRLYYHALEEYEDKFVN